MTDLLTRLRRLYVQHGTDYVQEAADEIERLRAELARKDEFYTRLADVHESAMRMWESDERECAMKAYEMAAELKGLREEVERLRHDIERHVEIACELATECERLRAELADARAPDCRLCRHLGIASKPTGLEYECILAGTNAACADGHKYTGLIPVRLYEKE